MTRLEAALPFQRNAGHRIAALAADAVEVVKAMFATSPRPDRPKRQYYPQRRDSVVEGAAMNREMFRL
jgi:hypothetical protein